MTTTINLEAAAKAAANVGEQALPDARRDIEAVIAALQRAQHVASREQAKLQGTPAQNAFGSIMGAFTSAHEVRASELRAAVAARALTVGHLRIAAFGRTHTGKSTLVEAMVRGDGATVSDGPTDFTKTATVYRRGHLDIVDLPGIEAFGAGGKLRDDIARTEVLAADVVLLVFDTINQKATEFAKVARWVVECQKPLVVLLNVKGEWRRKDLLDRPKHRVGLQTQVEQHAAHIKRQLTALGLDDTPVIAINAQLSLFSRGSEPWKNEHLDASRKNLLAEFGAGALLQVSNFSRFEEYLYALVLHGGPRLRIAALDGEVAQSARGARDALRDAGEATTKLARDVLLPQVEATIRLVGTAAVDPSTLAEVHAASNKQSLGTTDGDIARHAEDLLLGHIDKLEREALAEARRIVQSEEALDKKAFATKVLPEAKVMEAHDAVCVALRTFVKGRLANVQAELGSDLQAILDGTETTGQGGVWKRAAGWLLGAATAAGGIGLLFAELTFWPATAAVVVLGFLGWLGSKLRGRAQADRAAERAANLHRAEKWVGDACIKLRLELRRVAGLVKTEVATALTLPLTGGYLALHRVGEEAAAQQVIVGAVVARRSKPSPLGPAMTKAREVVVSRTPAPVGADPVAWTLLGGDWVDGPTRGQAQRPAPLPTPLLSLLAPLPVAIEADADWITGCLRGLGSEDRVRLATDEVAALKLARARRRRIVLAGEYNASKSSLIRRLLLQEGLAVPPSLGIAAHPETDRPHAYEFGPGAELVDTPGFGSPQPEHDRLALVTSAAAPAGLLCVNPSLFTGPMDVPKALLAGSKAYGTAPGQGRWRVLVTRADALGTSPVDDPKGWAHLRDRKRAEVGERLKTWGASRTPIAFVAADPFQRAGARSDVTLDDFEGTDGWDGFKVLHVELEGILAAQTRTDVVRAAGRSLGPSLAVLGAEHRVAAAQLKAAAQVDEQLVKVLAECEAVLRGTAAGIHQRVLAAVDAEAAAARAAIVGAGDEHALIDALERHQHWPKSIEASIGKIDRSLQAAVRATLDWAADRMQKRLDSPTGRLAAEGAGSRRGTSESPKDTRKAKKMGSGLGSVGQAGSRLAEKLGLDPKLLREEIKTALKGIKKWKPWEATKLAEKLNQWAPKIAKFSKVLGVASVVIEAGTLVLEERRRRAFETTKAKALKELSETVTDIVLNILTPKDAPGLGAAVEAIADEIGEHAASLHEEADDNTAAHKQLLTRIKAIEHALDLLLSTPGP